MEVKRLFYLAERPSKIGTYWTFFPNIVSLLNSEELLEGYLKVGFVYLDTVCALNS